MESRKDSAGVDEASGLRLNALCLRHPQAELLQRALTTIGLNTARVEAGAASLRADIHTPRGDATLHSHP